MTVSGQESKAMSGFAGLRVLALESRRAPELSKLISNYGGLPIVAQAMREVPLESNSEALAFAAKLFAGEFDVVIFLTGVGARALLGALDDAAQSGVGMRLDGARVAVQEYGISNPELLDGLVKRGALVTRVPVYQWALPDDLAPLRAAIQSLAHGKIDVVFFTTSVQAVHLFEVAAAMNLEKEMRRGLERAMVASIGPTTSEELSRQRIRVDLEPSHPKMGFLVKEAAEQAAELIRRKPEGSASA